MYVRVNFGINAGKIIDMRPDIAQELLKSGRATDPRFEKQPNEVASELRAAPPQTATPGRKRRLFRSN